MPQGDLAVRSDIAQQRGVGPLAHPAGQHGAAYVRADKRVQTRRQIGRPAEKAYPGVKKRVGLERRARKGERAAAGQKVEHGRIAGDDERPDVLLRDRRIGADGGEKRAQRVRYLRLHRLKPSVESRADAAHHVRRRGDLRIRHPGRAETAAGGKLKQLQRDGGRADVGGGAISAGHGPGRRDGGFAAQLDLAQGLPLRQIKLRVAQKHGLARKTSARAPFLFVHGRGGACERHGALAAQAPSAAGVRHGRAGPLQKRGQRRGRIKGQCLRRPAAVYRKLGHVRSPPSARGRNR